MAAKYGELAALGSDFLDLAVRGATTVVNEFFLPPHEKTIQAVGESRLDGRFKVWVDDHGIFNGSDEAAAKGAGNDLRACLAYAKCHLEDLVFPLETTLPSELSSYSESGVVRKAGEDMVLGTGNQTADLRLSEAATQLNLVRHAVKGQRDILNTYLYASVD